MLEGLRVSDLFAIATIFSVGMAVVLVTRQAWRNRPAARRAEERRERTEELRELAKRLETALADLVGVLDANVTQGYEEDRIKPAYAQMLQLLTQLNIRFKIRVPMDPFDLTLPDNAARLHKVVAYAIEGDRREARRIAKGNWSKGPWASIDNDL